MALYASKAADPIKNHPSVEALVLRNKMFEESKILNRRGIYAIEQ